MSTTNDICQKCDTLTITGSDPVFEKSGVSFTPHECTHEMLTEEEGMDMYDEMLDECYPGLNVAGYTFYASTILKKCDPIAYRVGFSEYADQLAENGTPVEGYI